MIRKEQRARRLIAGMAGLLRECEAGEVAEAHLGAIVGILRPKLLGADIVGKGDIRVNPQLLFGKNLEGLQAAAERKMDYGDLLPWPKES